MNTHNSPNATKQSRQRGGKRYGMLNMDLTHRAMCIVAVCFILLLFSLIGVIATLKDAHASGAKNASTISVVKPPKPTPTPTMGTTPTPTVGITPTPTPTVGITPTPTPIIPTPTPGITPTATPQPQPTIGTTPTVAPTTPAAPIATSTPVPAQVLPATRPTSTQQPTSGTPTPSNGGATTSSGTPPAEATVPPTTTQNNSTNTHTTTPQSSQPGVLGSTTTLVVVAGTALLLLTGGSVAGLMFYNRRMTAQALASSRNVAPASAESVQAAWAQWQPSASGSFGAPEAATSAYAGASFAMANNISAQPMYIGPRAPITPQPSYPASNTPMTPADNPVYQQQVEVASSATSTDPALEAIMRQAQVGIFLIPGKE